MFAAPSTPRSRLCSASLTLAAVTSAACGSAPPRGAGTGSTGSGDGPATVESTLAGVGLDPVAMDPSADPCVDFYQYACGGWLAKTEIPADRARYGRFSEMSDRNEVTLREILEAARGGAAQSPADRQIGAFYGSCMDEEAVESAGLSALHPLLAKISSISNRRDLDAVITLMHTYNVGAPFEFEAAPDLEDATRVIAWLEQSGLGLPDRSYYLDDKDDKMAALRAKYKEHVQLFFELLGQSRRTAMQAAADVLALETELAKVSKTRVELRDPKSIYNPVGVEGLRQRMPSFDWKAYQRALGVDLGGVAIDAPDFFAALEPLRTKQSLTRWKNYLTWQVLDHLAAALPRRFVDQDFEMTRVLTGATEQPERWRRCITATDQALGELLAQPYVDRKFGSEGKTAANEMVGAIVEAFRHNLRGLSWMTEATRAAALVKLDKMTHLVGYPDRWKEYAFDIDPANYAANVLASRAYEMKRNTAKVGKPTDRSEWFMTPQTVNAYYNPVANQMVFPAGVLQSPFFDTRAHIAVNLGAIGMIVGHELTHGFDDSGAKFDGDGNLRDWWASGDREKFDSLGECVVSQYAAYSPLEGVNLNGELTLGENIADMGGVKLAFAAFRRLRAGATEKVVANGLSEDQLFFVATAQTWCSKTRAEEIRRRAVTDAHSPPRFRIIGSLSNSPEFAQAFSCEVGQPLAPAQRCQVW